MRKSRRQNIRLLAEMESPDQHGAPCATDAGFCLKMVKRLARVVPLDQATANSVFVMNDMEMLQRALSAQCSKRPKPSYDCSASL